MVPQLVLFLFCVFIHLIYATCDNYWQSSSPASTKRPFDICYRSEIDENARQYSYKYFCNQSNHGNNSINGYTAFVQDFNTINCQGTPNQTALIQRPFSIHCGSTCDIVRIREYPLTNAETCEGNSNIYTETIEVIGVCDDNIGTAQLVSCSASNNKFYTYDTFFEYGGICDQSNLFESRVNYAGCQSGQSTFLEILQCDNETNIAEPDEISESCSNYWQSNIDGASSVKRPFDICYRSYRNSLSDNYSYRYICGETPDTITDASYSINGYSVFKQYFNDIGCQGEPNNTLLEDIIPYSIHCGGNDCDIVRFRIYEINNTDFSKGLCDNPGKIYRLNDYEEKIHVIQQCDDDYEEYYRSDSYFCTDNYFLKNTYNNDVCNNNGIYTSEYWYEGCNDYDQYIEVVQCQQPTTSTTKSPTSSPTGSQRGGQVGNKHIYDRIIIVILTLLCIF